MKLIAPPPCPSFGTILLENTEFEIVIFSIDLLNKIAEPSGDIAFLNTILFNVMLFVASIKNILALFAPSIVKPFPSIVKLLLIIIPFASKVSS